MLAFESVRSTKQFLSSLTKGTHPLQGSGLRTLGWAWRASEGGGGQHEDTRPPHLMRAALLCRLNCKLGIRGHSLRVTLRQSVPPLNLRVPALKNGNSVWVDFVPPSSQDCWEDRKKL